jgi:AbrB family looped-hinge helix DNA binding protein
MATVFSTVSSKGQIVIPADLREDFGIRPGTRVAIRREGDALVLQPVTAEFVKKVAGSYKGKTSMVAARKREHQIER